MSDDDIGFEGVAGAVFDSNVVGELDFVGALWSVDDVSLDQVDCVCACGCDTVDVLRSLAVSVLESATDPVLV